MKDKRTVFLREIENFCTVRVYHSLPFLNNKMALVDHSGSIVHKLVFPAANLIQNSRKTNTLKAQAKNNIKSQSQNHELSIASLFFILILIIH